MGRTAAPQSRQMIILLLIVILIVIVAAAADASRRQHNELIWQLSSPEEREAIRESYRKERRIYLIALAICLVVAFIVLSIIFEFWK
jgi:uncharacterized membrane protein